MLLALQLRAVPDFGQSLLERHDGQLGRCGNRLRCAALGYNISLELF
jgi:hypothetical protein